MKFIVYGDPQGKARPRFTNKGRTYTPRNTVEYEKRIRDTYIAAGGEFMFGYVRIDVEAVFEVPKSYSKKNKQKAIDGTLLPAKKPDVDNILKCVLDGLNSVAYKDDSQVISAHIRKLYGEQSRIIVHINGVDKAYSPEIDRRSMAWALGV